MSKVKHKYNISNPEIARKSSSGASCVKCGCLRRYVQGVQSYFIGDTAYGKIAPPCDESLVSKSDHKEPEATLYQKIKELGRENNI